MLTKNLFTDSTLWLETIAIENGTPALLPLHLARIQRTQQEIWGQNFINTLPLLKPPSALKDYPLIKCRLFYAQAIEKIEYSIYTPRLITALHLVEASHLDYHLKSANRTALMALTQKFGPKEDILITTEGFLRDTSFSNIVLFDGFSYYTPKNPLLKGVQRQNLLAQNLIKEKTIHQKDLPHFHKIYLINALLNWQRKLSLPICAIHH